MNSQNDNPLEAEFRQWFSDRCSVSPALVDQEALLRETYMAGANSAPPPVIVQGPPLTAIGRVAISHSSDMTIVDRHFVSLQNVPAGEYATYIIAIHPDNLDALAIGVPQPALIESNQGPLFSAQQLTDYAHFVASALSTQYRPIMRGYFKLIEEMGETLQVMGKLGAFPDGDHPDGKGCLWERFHEEAGDLKGSLNYVIKTNGLQAERIDSRASGKEAQFDEWVLSGVPAQPV